MNNEQVLDSQVKSEWFHSNPNGWSREELLQLYQLIDNREKNFREELFRFINFYSAVCYAILGLTISGAASFYINKGKISLFFIFGPVLTLIICYLAIRVTKKTYHRIMEEVSVKIKLEHLLGLDSKIAVQYLSVGKPVWPKDRALLPPRHWKRRFKEDFSGDFIRDTAPRGLFREIKNFFLLIAILCIILAAAITLVNFY